MARKQGEIKTRAMSHGYDPRFAQVIGFVDNQLRKILENCETPGDKIVITNLFNKLYLDIKKCIKEDNQLPVIANEIRKNDYSIANTYRHFNKAAYAVELFLDIRDEYIIMRLITHSISKHHKNKFKPK
jgi:hypothetical protein